MNNDRYSRQTIFPGIGAGGQARLAQSRVAIFGLGALGSTIADELCRAGVGHLRLVDRDYVELGNLHRQTLYDELDARDGLPKAAAAAARLRRVNSDIELDAEIRDVNPGTVERLIENEDLVLDGTDNIETRLLINEACHKHGIPWIYGGAVGDSGMTMNIIPGETACFRCICPVAPPPGSMPTCSSAGVLGMLTAVIGSIEAAEALKILVGSSAVRKTLLAFNIWDSSTEYIELQPVPECPVCSRGRYEALEGAAGSSVTMLCGRDAFQIVPPSGTEVDFARLAARLAVTGSVNYNQFMLTYVSGELELRLFRDGRAILKNVRDESAAKSAYAQYVGL